MRKKREGRRTSGGAPEFKIQLSTQTAEVTVSLSGNLTGDIEEISCARYRQKIGNRRRRRRQPQSQGRNSLCDGLGHEICNGFGHEKRRTPLLARSD